MTTFHIIYLLIAIFVLGAYAGATIERGEKITFSDSFSMGVLAALWIVVLCAFAYTWIKEKAK